MLQWQVLPPRKQVDMSAMKTPVHVSTGESRGPCVPSQLSMY